MARKGKLITFEGIDGSGKSTQIRLLTQALKRDEIPFLLAREPGGTPVGESIREILLNSAHREMDAVTELFLFEAARAQLIRDLIRPALDAGKLVLLDRFTDSTVAYQGYGRGLGVDRVTALNDAATSGLIPDRTFLLDLPAEEGIDRMRRSRPGKSDRLDTEGLDFTRRVREGYLEVARQSAERVTVIDALRPIEAIESDIYGKIREDLVL
ncbi:MAG: dTMP kinase [Fastidiosipilaceae bacterium]|jgi:dTMP kinase